MTATNAQAPTPKAAQAPTYFCADCGRELGPSSSAIHRGRVAYCFPCRGKEEEALFAAAKKNQAAR